ncbi:MAG: DUF2079 domain-containing protein [Thermoprotei archaeon]
MKELRYTAGATLLFLCYSSYWSYITIVKYYNLQATILDLGGNAQLAWNVLSNPSSYFRLLATSHGSLIPWVLVFLPKSYPFALAFQSFWIGFGSIPLFLAVKHKMGSDRMALGMSALYLTYFPLAGMNWFDFHVEVLFPTIFLVAYYFYVKGSHWACALTLCVAASARFPYTIFPLMFSAIELGSLKVNGAALVGKRSSRLYPYLTVLAYCVAVSVYFVLMMSSGSVSRLLSDVYLPTSTQSQPAGVSMVPSYNQVMAVPTFFLFFAPLLFIPLLSARWWPFYLPYLVEVFKSGDPGLHYPYVFVLQYPAMMAPFVFLGALDVLPGILRFMSVSKKPVTYRPPQKASRPLLDALKKGAFLILVVGIAVSGAVTAAYYDPYGPLNQQAPLPYNVSYSPQMNFYSDFQKLVSLIPPDSTVLVQNNMPQVYPTQLHGYIQAIDTAFWQYSQSTPNLSVIGAVLADPWSPWFYASGSTSPSYSMETALTALWATGEFGVLGESDGVLLLVRGYCGAPKFYVPLNISSELNSTSYLLPLLAPGTYWVTLTAANTQESNVTLRLSGSQQTYSYFMVPALKNKSSSVSETEITLPSLVTGAQLEAVSNNSTVLTLTNIKIVQLSVLNQC